jgi:hypothetical protein
MYLLLAVIRQLACYAGQCKPTYRYNYFDLMLCRFHLVRNRKVLERLQREIAIVPKEGEITRDQIRKLPFLQCCLNESLFYPPYTRTC